MTLPSYEEALRDSSHGGAVPISSTTNLGSSSSSRHAPIFESGLTIAPQENGHHQTALCAPNDRSIVASYHGLTTNPCNGGGTNGHAPHSPYRPHTINENGGSAGLHLSQASRHHNVRQQGGRGGPTHHASAASRNHENR